jgi:hypothetical protein
MFTRNFPPVLALAVFVIGTGACNGAKVAEPGIEPRPAILQFYSDPVHIDLPDSVARGSAFYISVRTYGGGCASQGHTEVEINDLLAKVEPFDLEPTDPNVVCPEVLRVFEHVVSIRFDEVGTATVRVFGRRQPGDETLSVDRTVVVR